MKKFLGSSSLEFLTPWHASVLNAKTSISKYNNGVKFIKPQYSSLINVKLVKRNIEETKKK